MFAQATKNFLDEADKKGVLIPISSLNEPFNLLTLVVKRNRFWFWQKPKYLPSDFKLEDVLTEGEPLKPEIFTTDFLKYTGSFADSLESVADADFQHGLGSGNLSIKGKGSSKLKSSFGDLAKEEVNIPKMLKDLKNRTLDMSHPVIRETKEKNRRVIAFVKERILTTAPSSVVEEEVKSGQCGAGLSLSGPLHKVSLKENTSLTKDSNVTMEIPPHTAVAYGLIELEVKRDGRFELCVMSDTDGGFESDVVDDDRDSDLQQDLEPLESILQQLSALPAATKSALFQKITELMQSQLAISALHHALDQISEDKKIDLDESSLDDSQQQNVKAVLDLLEKSSELDLSALHLLISGLHDMPSDCLAILRASANPKLLQALEKLVKCVASGQKFPLDGGELEKVYEDIKRLFGSMNVTLEKENDTLKTDLKPQSGNLPLVLCISVRGLASLATNS